MQLFDKELSELENEQLTRAEQLKTIVSMPGWPIALSILNDISQKMYPNPEAKKYDLFPWKNLEKDYTFARGATKLASEFISTMTQQEDIAKRLHEKREAAIKADREEGDLYEGLRRTN